MWLQLADAAGAVLVAGQTRARAVGEHQGRRPRDRIGPAPASSARLNRVEVLAGGRTGGSDPAGAVLAVPSQPLDSSADACAPRRVVMRPGGFFTRRFQRRPKTGTRERGPPAR